MECMHREKTSGLPGCNEPHTELWSDTAHPSPAEGTQHKKVLSCKLKYYFLNDRTLTVHFTTKDAGDFTFSLDDLDKMTP